MSSSASPQTPQVDPSRQLLRHMLATLAYRGGKAFRGAPEGFAEFRAASRTEDKTRTPAQILAHIGDLLDWALSLVKGKQEWHDSPPLAWADGVARFFAALEALDAALASDVPLGGPVEKIFQGPIADAFTHVGQISMLRRLAGSPVRAENYLRAQIRAGNVRTDQPAPKAEFD
jgi:hypothetical protein